MMEKFEKTIPGFDQIRKKVLEDYFAREKRRIAEREAKKRAERGY